MKIVQILVRVLLSACALVLGVLLLVGVFQGAVPVVSEAAARYVAWPAWIQRVAWVLAGVALVAMGVIGLLPTWRKRRGRQITFAGPHGDVFIDLNSVEATINREVGQMAEVNKVHVRLTPVDESRKVDVAANVVLNPPVDGSRQATHRVMDRIRRTAIHLLGTEEITRVALNVDKILIDRKAVLQLGAPTPPPAAAVPPAEPATEIEGLEEAEAEAQEEIEEVRREAAEKNAPKLEETPAPAGEAMDEPAPAKHVGLISDDEYLPATKAEPSPWSEPAPPQDEDETLATRSNPDGFVEEPGEPAEELAAEETLESERDAFHLAEHADGPALEREPDSPFADDRDDQTAQDRPAGDAAGEDAAEDDKPRWG